MPSMGSWWRTRCRCVPSRSAVHASVPEVEWRLWIDGETHDEWRAAFSVRSSAT